MRTGVCNRKTAETEITLELNLDGCGKSTVETGCGFLDHMLTLFAAHSGFDLQVRCKGDTQVDDHHTVEDIGLALGKAFYTALGDKRGVCRYGSFLLPMDEALILSAVDLSGRACLCFDLEIPAEKIGTFDSELVEEFFLAFIRQGRLCLHLKKLAGKNSHHIAEGAFKSVARALRAATQMDASNPNQIPSTKGVLE